jgi:hypothetical protein
MGFGYHLILFMICGTFGEFAEQKITSDSPEEVSLVKFSEVRVILLFSRF